MKLLFGLLFVPACVIGGFVLHHGNVMALVVPTEYLIIGGCLLGGMIIQNPMSVMIGILKQILALLGGNPYGKKQYLELLQMVYELLQLARREGVLGLEDHANDPDASSILSKYPGFLKDRNAVAFLCDSIKLFVAGSLDAHGLDELMERDLEAMLHEELGPSQAMQHAADSLPAIGIVAAVLGIILTMSAIDEGAAAVGRKVAGALVGTFLGVFMAYGFVGPLAGALANRVHARERYYQCIRYVLGAAVGGLAPATAVECGRRGIFTADRPGFEELEQALRELKG